MHNSKEQCAVKIQGRMRWELLLLHILPPRARPAHPGIDDHSTNSLAQLLHSNHASTLTGISSLLHATGTIRLPKHGHFAFASQTSIQHSDGGQYTRHELLFEESWQCKTAPRDSPENS